MVFALTLVAALAGVVSPTPSAVALEVEVSNVADVDTLAAMEALVTAFHEA